MQVVWPLIECKAAERPQASTGFLPDRACTVPVLAGAGCMNFCLLDQSGCTLPRAPFRSTLRIAAYASRSALDLSGCCQAHSNCSAWTCMGPTACGEVRRAKPSCCCRCSPWHEARNRPVLGSRRLRAPCPRAGTCANRGVSAAAEAIETRWCTASITRSAHRLVRTAPDVSSPLCCRMRRCGLTVNLQ